MASIEKVRHIRHSVTVRHERPSRLPVRQWRIMFEQTVAMAT
jgi:hypothetical protein